MWKKKDPRYEMSKHREETRQTLFGFAEEIGMMKAFFMKRLNQIQKCGLNQWNVGLNI